ncbi:MAG: hypothetical protein AAF845_14060 [Bacteroidota bacterium]
MRTLPVLTVFLLVASVTAQPSLDEPSLGETSFENSGAEAAQAPFLRGLLLLHSFEYRDAREAFQEAREIDPDFAMAAWGEAMTHNHPIWLRQDREAALEALGRLGDDWATAGATARENAYLGTLAVLFGEGDKEDRDDAYAEAMAALAAAYPDDLDAQAFYALALLGTAHEGRDFTTYMRAAAVAEEVFAANPRHPGAAHYLIHAYDDPVHAPLGLRAARVYDQIAPAASHALHMPSHIYLALGMWDETAEMNRRSYEAARANTDARGEPLNGHGWHALWWWHYAETQRDDPEAARRLYDLAVDLAAADPDGRTAQAHIVRIRSEHAVAFGAFDVFEASSPGNISISTAAVDLLARGMARSVQRDPAGAEAALAQLQARLDADDDPSWTARAAALQLEAVVRLGAADPEAALALAEEAAQVENEAPLTFGPPAPVIPTNEMMGRLLLDLGRPAEAAVAFEAALARAPGRRQALAGLAEAEALMAAR